MIRTLGTIILIFISSSVSAQTVTEIYTDYGGYWYSSSTNLNPVRPDNTHDLLAFTWNGTTFSTGVDDALLASNSVSFTSLNIRAFPISSVPTGGSSFYIGLGQLYDGIDGGGDSSTDSPFTANDISEIAGFLTDGPKGLNIGTGLANIGAGSTLTFNLSSNGITGSAINDGEPDVIFAQIASPSSGSNDRLKFVDTNGNTVGTEITFDLSNNTDFPTLGNWLADFYEADSTPGLINTERTIKIFAADLQQFGITSGNFGDAVALVYTTGGNSDPAFLAFNEPAISVATTLVITSQPPATYSYGQTLTSNITVEVRDGANQTIEQAGTPITVSIYSGNGTLAGTFTQTTNASGVATFNDLSISGTGTQTLRFTSSSLEPATSNDIDPDFITWTGNTNSDWNTSSNWEPQQVPGSGDDVYIPDVATQPSFGSDSEIENLSVGTDGSLALDEGDALTVTGTIDDSGEIIVNSGALFNNQGSSSPQLSMYRDLDGVEGWRYITSPTSTTLQTLLGPIWTQGAGINGVDAAFGIPNVYYWGTVTENNREDWIPVSDLTEPVTPGQGYLVYVYADDNYDGSPDPFPKELNISGSEFAVPVSSTTNSADNTSWTLLGNPFATAVNYNTLQNGQSITDAVYVWTPGDTGSLDESIYDTGSWATYSVGSGTGDLTDGLIAPFQAFFVQNDGANSVSLSFSNSVKSSNAANTNFLFKEIEIPENKIRLEISGNGMRNSAWLTFSQNGSVEERVEGDAWQLDPMSSDYALLATQKSDGSLFDIGHFPVPQTEKMEMPLVTEATRSGIYTLQLTDFNTSDNLHFYFRDNELDIQKPLNKDFIYEFEIQKTEKSAPENPFSRLEKSLRKEAGKRSSRFSIIALAGENSVGEVEETPETFTLKQNYPNPFNPTTVIRYELPQASQVRLEVFDMAGRQIATLVNSQQTAGNYSVNFDGSDLSSGVYMYRLQAGNQIFTKKLTLIK